MLGTHVSRRDERGLGAGAGDELEAPAQALGQRDVLRAQARDAGPRDLVGDEAAPEGELREDRELVGRVDPLDVVGRVGLREAEALRLGERALVRLSLEHLGEDEVGRTVEDAADLEDLLAGEGLRDRAHDRDRPADRRLVGDGHAPLGRERAQFGAARREQVLVGGDDVLAGAQRRLDEPGRDAGPPDAFDDDVDRGIADQRLGVFGEERGGDLGRTGFRKRTHGDRREPVVDSAAGRTEDSELTRSRATPLPTVPQPRRAMRTSRSASVRSTCAW